MRVKSPAVSILLLAYQQVHFVRRAVEACLAQEGGPYEVILSDDASTDGTYEAIQDAVRDYHGPHEVRVRQSRVNLGIGCHYNELVDMARGELLVTAAADDISAPDRVNQILATWHAGARKADLIASHVFDLDDDGCVHGVIDVDDLSNWRTPTEWIRNRPYVIGAGQAFTKRLFKRFGPLHTDVFYEDQILGFRAVACGGAVTIPRPLVFYRRGGTSHRPHFDDAQSMFSWTRRQSGRELAVMQQLLADARITGCEDTMRRAIGHDLLRASYMYQVCGSSSVPERFRVLVEHADLPLWWRCRRALHSMFPRTTFAVKNCISDCRGALRLNESQSAEMRHQGVGH